MWFYRRLRECFRIKHALIRLGFNILMIQSSSNHVQELRLVLSQLILCWCCVALEPLARGAGSIFFSLLINTLKFFRIWRHICLLIQFGPTASTCLYSNPGFHLLHTRWNMRRVSGRCRCAGGRAPEIKTQGYEWMKSNLGCWACFYFFTHIFQNFNTVSV